MQVEDGALRYALLEKGGERVGLGLPDCYDWTNVKYFMEFLKLFYNITIPISDTQYYTVNIYFKEIALQSLHLRKSCDEATWLLHGMTIKLKLKFNKYWRF